MQYQPENEKVGMVSGVGYQSVPKPLLLTQDPAVQRTRKIFIIILGVLLALCLGGLIISLIGIIFGSAAQDRTAGSQLGQSLVAIIIYGLGIFAAYRYSALGLRVFAWIGVVGLVLSGIGILIILALAIMAVIGASSTTADEGQSIFAALAAGSFIATVLLIAAFILSIIIIRLAFKLARLIDANRQANPEQV